MTTLFLFVLAYLSIGTGYALTTYSSEDFKDFKEASKMYHPLTVVYCTLVLVVIGSAIFWPVCVYKDIKGGG